VSQTAACCPEVCGTAPQHPQIWEFTVADFLVCARQDVHGLYILSPTARVAWEILKRGHTLGQAAEIFARAFGIPAEQAFEDVSRAWDEWSTGLLAPSFRTTDEATAERHAGPAPESGLGPLVFSADYLVFGKVIRLRLYDADVAWDLTPRVEPFRITYGADASDTDIEVSAGDAAFHVFVNGVHVSSETAVFATRVIVLQEFLRASSSQNWAAVLHAGACGSSSHCVLFPGTSHSGKTTLAAALVHQGMTFYGDDSIPLAEGTLPETLRVQPMPFALMAREGSWPILSTLFPGIEDAPVVDRWGEKVRYLTPPRSVERHSPSIAAIVFARYSAGSPTDFHAIPTFEALRRLTESGFWLEHNKVNIGSFLAWFASMPSYRLDYSDLGEATGVLHDVIPD
jgi:hypothetical protein